MAAFSIWLQPPTTHSEFPRLAELIEKVSSQFHGPGFQPHVTLLGGIRVDPCDTADVESKTRSLAASIQPFSLRLLPGGVATADTWSQDLLIFVEETEDLVQAHNAAIRAFRGPEAAAPAFAPPTRRPHVSLLYGEHDQKEREAAAAWVREHAPWADEGLAFPVEALQLWATDKGLGGVPEWHLVGSYPLGTAA
mmetsp:Transcript_2015/g.6486  ORF Transcript_2015/g.6486 Transcript_2015/m.6486 type:complete len:194 (-) Transcript_2015:135-716(-)